MKQAEKADSNDSEDGQKLPKKLARRQALKAKLDAACKKLEQRKAESLKREKVEHEQNRALKDARQFPPKAI